MVETTSSATGEVEMVSLRNYICTDKASKAVCNQGDKTSI